MENLQLEQAIKSDLETISTLKMGTVSAKDFYVPLLALVFKISLVLLVINASAWLVLKAIGVYHPAITVSLLTGTWFGCLTVSCLLGFSLSRFVLISKLMKGRLKTATLIKQKYRHFGLMYLGLYAVTYLLFTAFFDSGMGLEEMDRQQMGAALVVFSATMTQVFAFLVATVTTTLMAGVELDRLGLGALFNVLSDAVKKAKQRNQAKDA